MLFASITPACRSVRAVVLVDSCYGSCGELSSRVVTPAADTSWWREGAAAPSTDVTLDSEVVGVCVCVCLGG